jgi:prevent-host-death family protein
MQPIITSEDILPVGEFKAHVSKVFRHLRDTGRPVIITQNGKPAAVLITPEEFDQFRERERFVESVQRGLADVEAGRVIGDTELSRELDAEFGPLDEKV